MSAGLPIGKFQFDSTGRLKVDASFGANTASTSNSTTTPLGIAGVFNGAYEQVLDFSQITLTITADQDAAAGGVVVTWSTDGVTDDTVNAYDFLLTEGSKTIIIPVQAEFYKVDYTNGGVGQATFRMEVRSKTSRHVHRIKCMTLLS